MVWPAAVITTALASLAIVLGVADGRAQPTVRGAEAVVASVIDGDTIKLTDGRSVRLLQIDAPEPGTAECFSRAAGRELRGLLPAGTRVTLEPDPPLDLIDRYGRLLRYVHRGSANLNVELVRRGAATVWFHRAERGRHSATLLSAASSARTSRRGIWGACPSAVWNPLGPATTGPGSPAAATPTPRRPIAGGRCDSSYPTVCIPPAPPDLDCADVSYTNFRVRPPDPHRFDGEGDGLGCES